MNYIELINQFWQTRRSKRITNLQADLYYYLLQECNVRGWENPFEVSNKFICANIGITEPSLIDARNRLQQLGLIDFQGGKRNVISPVYYLKCNLNDFSRNRVTPLVETEQQVKLKGEPFNKLNLNQTIKEVPPLPPEEEIPKEPDPPKKKKQPEALQMPFSSGAFSVAWQKLQQMPKWRKKLPLSLQMALDKLSRYDEEFSIELINRAIEGDYQGVVFSDTDDNFLKWKARKGKPGQILHADQERLNAMFEKIEANANGY